jgi:hypothetical protein
MDFKITDLEIPDDSPEGRMIEEIMARDSVSASEALRSALRATAALPPLNARIGSRPPLRTDDAEAVIGLFQDRPDLVDSILDVVSEREQRYSKGPDQREDD